MREPPAEIRAWLRHDLSQRHGAVMTEDLPVAMLDILRQAYDRD